MDEYRVSVVIPAYRCVNTLRCAIDSIFAQTRRPDEIIVVDDGSPDDIAAAVAPYGAAVTLLKKTNGGAASARNVGLDAATGNMIAFLDADDLWMPEKLESQLRIFQDHPEVGLVSSRYLIRQPSGAEGEFPGMNVAPWDQVLRPRGAQVFDLAIVVWTSVVIFRRELLGSERFDTTLQIAEDRDLWVRLVIKSPIWIQSRLTATLVAGPDSLSRADVDLDCQCMLRLIRRYRPLLGQQASRRWEAQVYRRWAGTHMGQGDTAKALKPAIRRLFYQPLSLEGWWALAKSSVLSVRRRKESGARLGHTAR